MHYSTNDKQHLRVYCKDSLLFSVQCPPKSQQWFTHAAINDKS